MLEETKPDVVSLSEVELDKDDSSFYIPGYKAYFPTPHLHKLRVLLLLKDSLVRSSNPTVLAVSHQEIWIRLSCPSGSGSWTLAACYRQWSSNEKADLNSLCDNIVKFSTSSPRVLLMGDFNLDVARQSDPSYYRRNMLSTFLSMLDEVGFVLENDITTPTYRSHGCFQSEDGPRHRESVLDLIFSLGLRELQPEVGVLANAAGDHRPVLASFPVLRIRPGMEERRCRDWKKVTPEALLMAVNAERLSGVFEEEDVDKIADTIVEELVKALDLIAPPKPTLIKNRQTPLYLKRETREIMAARDAAANKKDWQLYRRLRNLAARRVRRDRVDSNLELLNKFRDDPGRVWKLADSLTGRGRSGGLPPQLEQDGRLVEGDDKLADVMNHHYISKIAKIREKIEREKTLRPDIPLSPSPSLAAAAAPSTCSSSTSSTSSTSGTSSPFTLHAPSAWEVRRAIGKLRNTPALGEDGIPTGVLKDLAQVLAAPLAHLVGRSIAAGRVPTAFKIANVVPIHKRGKDPSQPSSYRPVAILSALSKVLESVVADQLVPFLAKRLPTEQWGFRRARGTAGALTAAHGCWTRAKVQGLTVVVAAFDFSNAFDTMGVEELVLKLRGLNFGGEAVLWFRDYLSNRRQRVRYGSATSSLRNVSFGVPQGSLLGPLLFTALTADLPSSIGSSTNNIGVTLYADDTCIWCAHGDPVVAKERLELASAKLLRFAQDNSLALNTSKTQIIWSNSPSPVLIGDALVQPEDELLLLGVKFDRKFSVRPHLQSLLGTSRSLLAMTRRLLLHLPRGRQVQEVVRALVVGRLCYGSILFTPRLSHGDQVCHLLQSLQTGVNNIARSLLGLSRADRISVEQLLADSNMPVLNRVVIKSIMCESWKCLRPSDGPNGSMNPLGMILSPPFSNRVLRTTRSISDGSLPPPPLRVRADTFAWHAVKLYNDNVPLRSAQTYAAAHRVAESVSSAAPI